MTRRHFKRIAGVCFFGLLSAGCSKERITFVAGKPALELRIASNNHVVFSSGNVDKVIVDDYGGVVIQIVSEDILAYEKSTKGINTILIVNVYGVKLGEISVTAGLSGGLIYLYLPVSMDTGFLVRKLKNMGVRTSRVESVLDVRSRT